MRLLYSYADDKAVSPSSGPVGQLSLSFATPYETIVKDKAVYMVTVPAVTGVMGILADHAPTIAQLKPGLVTVHSADLNDITHRFVVSGGIAVMKNNSTAAVTAVEAIKVDDIDPTAARQGLSDAQSALARASDDKQRAEAQIGIDVYEAIIGAIETK